MQYLVMVHYDKVKGKQKTIIDNLFEGDTFQKFIVKSSDGLRVIKTPLFDYLEYDFFINPAIKSKARFSLLQVGQDNKAKKLIDKCKLNSEEFNLLLRTIRF